LIETTTQGGGNTYGVRNLVFVQLHEYACGGCGGNGTADAGRIEAAFEISPRVDRSSDVAVDVVPSDSGLGKAAA
jgi:hypothetical protein